MIIAGESGCGKSTLLARFFGKQSGGDGGMVKRKSHAGDVRAIIHHFGTSQNSSIHYFAIRRFMSIWKSGFDLEMTVPSPDQPRQLVDAFPEWIAKAAERASCMNPPCKVVLVLDGIERLTDTDDALSLSWLPWRIGPLANGKKEGNASDK